MNFWELRKKRKRTLGSITRKKILCLIVRSVGGQFKKKK